MNCSRAAWLAAPSPYMAFAVSTTYRPNRYSPEVLTTFSSTVRTAINIR